MQLFLKIPRVANAFDFMVEAHRDQKYGDLPYFVHPLQVAENLPGTPTEDQIIAALLHDVVEDTGFGYDAISACFGDRVITMVHALTKDNKLTYMGNILRVISTGDREIIGVKWSDNLTNMRSDKSHMPDDRRVRLNAKYAESFPILSAALGI